MRTIFFALILAAGCATAPKPVDVSPPAQYASIPRFVKGGPITAPVPQSRVEPQSQFRGSGTATIEMVVDENGNMVDAWYVAGNHDLANAMINSIRNVHFVPGKLDGKPVAVRVQMTTGVHASVVPQ